MKKLLLLLIIIIVNVHITEAQDVSSTPSKENSKSWDFLIEPYIMLPNMSGDAGLGALPEVSVNADTGDIFSRLQMGVMLNMEAHKDEWTIGSDFIYMSLKQDLESNAIIANGELKVKQFGWGVSGLYTITPWLDLGVGGMLNSLKLESDMNVNNIGGSTTNRTRNISQTWFDPMIIARTCSKRAEKFIYQLRADLGGFGIGSKFAYQFQAYAGYRFSESFQLIGGYRIIGADYEQDNDAEGLLNNNRFLYDMTTFGPVIRLGFNL